MKNNRVQQFDIMMENAVFVKNGVYALNQEILEEMNVDPVGMYQYTKKSAYIEKKYKGGQTERGIKRILEQIKSAEVEPVIITSWIPTEYAKIVGYDKIIHESLHKSGKSEWLHITAQKDSSGTEWSIYPSDNPDELWRDYIGNKQTRHSLELTVWQLLALDTFISKKKENKRKIMAELAARFGKTTLYLALFDLVDEKTMVVGSYYLTALSSFKKEVNKWDQFSNFELLDASDVNFEKSYNSALENNKKIVVIASLCGSTTVEKNSDFISTIKNKITVIDEADFGAHTVNVSPLVNKLGNNGLIILTTGTNSERAKGLHDDIDYFFRYTYFDMLVKKKMENIKLVNVEINDRYKRSVSHESYVADVRFTRLDWSNLAPVITNREIAPSFSKASQDVLKATQFWTEFYKILVGVSDDVIANDNNIFNVINQYNETTQSIIQFVSMRKSEMNKLRVIANAQLGKYFDVHIVNGDVVHGKEAEDQVKEWIRVAHKKNKHVWIITSFMCQRSFSIPEINVAVLSYDNGDKGATIQKMSRPLTAGVNKKIGHIISLSIDGNRDEKIAPIIMETAKKISDDEEIDCVDAIRRVLRTMPISQMDEHGYLVKMVPDEYAKEIFSTSDSHRLVINKERLFDFNINDKSYDIIAKVSLLNPNNRMSVAIPKGKTFIDKLEREKGDINQKKEEIHFLIAKLNTIMDNIKYSAKLIKSFGIELTYNKYVDMLNNDTNLSDGICLSGSELETLVNENYINKQLLSLYIECGV